MLSPLIKPIHERGCKSFSVPINGGKVTNLKCATVPEYLMWQAQPHLPLSVYTRMAGKEIINTLKLPNSAVCIIDKQHDGIGVIANWLNRELFTGSWS